MAPIEPIWYKDVQGFLAVDRLAVFVPDRDMAFEEQLNALMRLSLYFTAILLLLKQDGRVLFFAMAIAFFTFVVYEWDVAQKAKRAEVLERLNLRDPSRRFDVGHRGPCVKPTLDNPFMNVTYQDLKEFPKRPPACDITQKNVRKEVRDLFNATLRRDISDIYQNKASDRQYYTMPVTTIPNDQTRFAEWLYRSQNKTCKEGNQEACLSQLYNPKIRT
jgi:hypothetical protein